MCVLTQGPHRFKHPCCPAALQQHGRAVIENDVIFVVTIDITNGNKARIQRTVLGVCRCKLPPGSR